MLEEMDVDLPVDRLYHLLLDWFLSQRDVKVKGYSESEFIKVRVGHWGWRGGETPCEVNVNLKPKKMGITHIVFNFNFFKMGAVTAITTSIALILVGVFSGLVTVFSRLVTVAFCLIPLIFALLSVQQDIDKTKRRFMDRTRDFLTDGIIRVPKKGGVRELDIRPRGSQ